MFYKFRTKRECLRVIHKIFNISFVNPLKLLLSYYIIMSSGAKWSKNPLQGAEWSKFAKKGGVYMFSGKAYHNLDAKGRLFIPAVFREELGNQFIVAKGFSEPYLSVYPMREWESLIAKIDALGLDKDVRAMKRYIMMSASQTEMDSQGRIVLTKEHREYAGLEKEVVVIGMSNTIEIWDRNRLEGQTAEAPANLEDFLALLK